MVAVYFHCTSITLRNSLLFLLLSCLDPSLPDSSLPMAQVSYTNLCITVLYAIAKVGTINISKGITSARTIYALVNQVPKSTNSDLAGLHIENMNGSVPLIELRGVSFSYPSRPNRKVLNNLSLKIYANESVALVGSSGSGKTTIIQLLARFYESIEGEVLIAGVPIQHYSSQGLRQIFALVSQEPVLYQGTMAENINLGRPGQPLEQAYLDQVLMQTQLKDLVSSLPEGIQTLVGSRGSQLSGGQKQRVAIARAVAMETPVLLLDEATSALDSESERLIQTAIQETMQHKTVIAVAHRLSTIQHFNRSIVLHDGQMVESGTHDNLLLKKGRYWSMVEQQA